MRLFVWGLVIAAAIYLLSAGHILFLPLLFFIPLGGLFGSRRRRGYGWRGRRQSRGGAFGSRW